MSLRFQNQSHTTGQPPVWYANNRLYPGAMANTEWPTRISRRVHDGFSIYANYGLDTVSDDVNTSPYSSPYYVNGRYLADNLTTQRGNSSSVQGIKFLASLHDDIHDFAEEDIQTTIEMWQGKQIKFAIPYSGKVVGNTITIKNTDGCTGLLSIYLSASEDSLPICETTVDLCEVSMDKFEHFILRPMVTVPADANPRGKLYVRMEIWDEISQDRTTNPFNTGKKIEIAATGADGHYEASVVLGPKNVYGNDENYVYARMPNRPLLGLIYNGYSCVPVDRVGDQKTGASVSDKGYRYDIFCIKDESHAEIIIYDKEMRRVIEGPKIRVDGRVERVLIAQVVDTKQRNWVYYVDGYSPLQRFLIGTWQSEVVTPVNPDDADFAAKLGPSLLLFHNNRLYIGGFLNDKSLFQCSAITEEGPDYTTFPHVFYAPNNSPYALSTNTPTALVEYTSDTIMIFGRNFYSRFTTNVAIESPQSSGASALGTPTQQSSFMDSVGVQTQGDVVNYKGTLYSFDEKEGIRRFNGAKWSTLPNSVESHFDRVDMTKPRKIWGFANKLYFNYTDKVDGKAKCLIWDMEMNYQQFPWFQDTDIPFCDARYDESETIIGIHPDYPCIMELYAEDTWRRLDTPILFERHTKYLSVPGNLDQAIVKRLHTKVLANANRWWYIGLSVDTGYLKQYRGNEVWWREPCWATVELDDPAEAPFNYQPLSEEKSIATLSIRNIRVRCSAVQAKIMCKTFRNQASLISTIFEVGIRQKN